MRIAFATMTEPDTMPESDRLTATELERLGHTAHGYVWDGGESLDSFDALVIRSCWDYHLKADAFRSWVEGLQSWGKPVLNPVRTMLWNMDKRYLLEVGRHAPIIPTELILDPTAEKISETIARLGLTDAIVKPIIGASSFHNYRLRGEADYDQLRAEDLPRAMFLQPCMPSIESEGEYSLMFFDGVFSHAVLKRPAKGDHRAQEEFGGTADPVTPSEALLAVGQLAVGSSPDLPAYARIDLVNSACGPLIMEIELIEPELYMAGSPWSPGRFAMAIHERIVS